MAFDLSQLVVVCMRCPANATLLLVEMEAWHDSILIWCECHGEHVLGHVRGEAIAKARKMAPAGEPVRISLQGMVRYSRLEALELQTRTQETLTMAAKRLEAVNHFLASKDVKQPDPEPRYEHDCDRCVFLGRHGECDLYECGPQAGLCTLLARHSSTDGDFESVSVMPDATELGERYASHPLAEAMRLHVARRPTV